MPDAFWIPWDISEFYEFYKFCKFCKFYVFYNLYASTRGRSGDWSMQERISLLLHARYQWSQPPHFFRGGMSKGVP